MREEPDQHLQLTDFKKQFSLYGPSDKTCAIFIDIYNMLEVLRKQASSNRPSAEKTFQQIFPNAYSKSRLRTKLKF